ncbi:MAG: hypothetical protein RLO50_11100 [Azospirillaceae bacterium]
MHDNYLFRSKLSLFSSGEYPVRHLREFRSRALINGRILPVDYASTPESGAFPCIFAVYQVARAETGSQQTACTAMRLVMQPDGVLSTDSLVASWLLELPDTCHVRSKQITGNGFSATRRNAT